MAQARILIVEDETIVAMDIAATLRRLGYEIVGMVGTGEAAIELAQSVQPDLILMDIRIKGPMDGIEAASVIQQHVATPVVFLTAHADVDTVERAKAASPYGYLVKAIRRARAPPGPGDRASARGDGQGCARRGARRALAE